MIKIYRYVLAVLGVLFFSSYVFADIEGIAAYVNKFDQDNPGENRCCSGCDDLSTGDNLAGYLADKLDTWGWDRINEPANTGVEFHEWADVNEDGSGADHSSPYGADSFDIAYISTHGGYDCSPDDWSRIWMGDGTEECTVNYGEGSANDAMWGDSDLNIIILDACQTAKLCVWEGGGYGSNIADGNLMILNGLTLPRKSGQVNYAAFRSSWQ